MDVPAQRSGRRSVACVRSARRGHAGARSTAGRGAVGNHRIAGRRICAPEQSSSGRRSRHASVAGGWRESAGSGPGIGHGEALRTTLRIGGADHGRAPGHRCPQPDRSSGRSAGTSHRRRGGRGERRGVPPSAALAVHPDVAADGRTSDVWPAHGVGIRRGGFRGSAFGSASARRCRRDGGCTACVRSAGWAPSGAIASG